MSQYDVGSEVNVLDHGYIKLVDVMGSDEEICKSARVSYHEESTKKVNEDKGLIDHLMRHRHTSPFEMGVMKFEVKLPIFVERQWVRHRTCSMNEMSGRYSEMPEEYYVPEIDAIRAQSKTNKQGRDEPISSTMAKGFIAGSEKDTATTFIHYRQDLKNDIARELARINLPLGTYTKKVWMMNLHNLLHFLGLRTHSHAQWEIRQYAEQIEKFVERAFPWTYASWKNHVKDAVRFSADEWKLIHEYLAVQTTGLDGSANPATGYQCMKTRIDYEGGLNKTRKRELKAKLGMK